MKKYKTSLILLALATTTLCGLATMNIRKNINSIEAAAPSDYYADCEGLTESSLKSKLLQINTPKSPSYDWSRYEVADEALDDSSSILCLYTRHNIPKGNHCGNYAWDKWNREHIWTQSAYPKSKTDNHNIFACEGQINNYRGDLPFGEVEHTSSNQKDIFGHKTDCYWTNSYFEPCDEAKGEVARSVMYGTVMYSYTMTNEIKSIDLALKWHLEHPITERDIIRNDRVYELQGNRNPFVDHPEYACKIWGNTNSATKALCASQPTPTKTLTNLKSEGTPNKKDYLVGESFDPTGLTITATFSDSSTKNVTNEVEWSSLQEGNTTVTGSYTYEGVAKAVTITGLTVKKAEKKLSSLNYAGTPNKKTYFVGESFDPTGLTVTATFSDSSTKNVTNEVEWSSLQEGNTTVTGSYTYEGVTKFVTISGISVTKPAKQLYSLSYAGTPNKKDYLVGESFDPTGLTITASFTDYSTEDVTDEVVWATLQEGKTSVTGSYTYEGVTRIVSINCITVTKPAKHLVSLSCEGAPNKKDYIEGETFNPYGLVIKANFDDGSFENVTNEVQWSDLFVGMTSVTGRYTYDGVTKDITISGITVYPDVDEKNLESLSFVGEPTKKIYCIGESFDSTGLTITATFSDDSSEIVNEQVVWDTLKLGDTSIKGSYTYKDVTKTISVPNITVYDEPVAVTGVTLTPSSSTLKVGSTTKLNCVIEPANATNKNVTWSSSDNSIATVSDNGLITALKEGNVTITVTTEDGNISASSNITVYNEELNREMVGIVAINLPNKVVYNVNETFSKEGLKVISIYNDGTHEDVTDLALVANPNLSSAGTKSIEISYNDFRTSFDIVVLKTTVKSLQLQRVPAKTEYFSNEPFNPYGCVIKALLSDNSELANVIDQCSFEYDFTKSNLVAASFGGQRIIFSITIIQGTPTVEHKAADFAYSFNEQMDEVNPENVTEEEWNSLEYYYNQLDEESKEYVKNLNNDSGNAVHAGACDEEALNQCVSKYDETYLAHKNDGFEDFIGRNPKAHNNNDNKDKDNSSLAIILGVIGGIVVLTIIIISIAVPVSKKNKKKHA